MSIKGLLFYSFLSIVLSIYFINSKQYLSLILELLILFIVFKKYDYKAMFLQIALFGVFCFYRINKKEIIIDSNVQEVFEIKEAKNKYLIVKKDNINYLVYVDNQEKIYENKDQIKISGDIIEIENDYDIDVFDFKEYLNNKRVYYQIDNVDIEIINKSNSYSKKIINFLTSKITDESYKMTKMLLFNDKNADIDSYENLKSINALHLFVVSGFHISFFFNIFLFIFKKNKNIGFIIGSIICSFYVFLLDFSISSTRALLTIISYKLFNKHLNKMDCIAFPGIMFLIIEPLNIYNYSFILSFLMTSVISLSNTFLSKQNKITQVSFVSLICFLTMIPIQLALNYKINFISLFSNIILSYVVMVIFILNIIGMMISFLNGNIFGFIYAKFNETIDKIASIKSTFLFGNMNIYLIIIYYILLLMFLYFINKEKYNKGLVSFALISIFMVCLYNRQYFKFYQQVAFLNVYQGDCCIIQDSFSNKVMLIDTGGIKNYDIASKKIIPYLEYHGIKKIDKVVISHNDFDHNGALESLINLIQIDEIIEDNYIESIQLGKIKLTNLNHYFANSSDDNDKSMVLYGNICSLNFLFTGDAPSTIEKKIIEDNNINVDVLKVAHHGSKYSTCKEFVESIKPTYAIISVGKNYYGHPSKEVLDILNDNKVKIYQTNKDGSTRFKGKIFNNLIIETAN